MRRTMVIVAVAGLAALPATASAANDGSTCGYTSSQQQHVDVGAAHVYVDTDGGAGMSGQAAAAAGACLDNGGTVGGGGFVFDGGTAEVGAGSTGNVAGTQAPAGVYGIVDGDNNNADPTGQGDGYIGVSTFETSWPPAAPGPGCSDAGHPSAGNTNSGGCFGVDNTPILIPGVPIACGNTSGNTWSQTNRDGCSIP